MSEQQGQSFSKKCSLCGQEKLLIHFLSVTTATGKIFGHICDQCLGLESLTGYTRKRKATKLRFAIEEIIRLRKLADNGDDDSDWGSGDRGKILKNLLGLGAGAKSAAHKADQEVDDKKEAEGKRYLQKLSKQKEQKNDANEKLHEQAEHSQRDTYTEKSESKQESKKSFLARSLGLLSQSFSNNTPETKATTESQNLEGRFSFNFSQQSTESKTQTTTTDTPANENTSTETTNQETKTTNNENNQQTQNQNENKHAQNQSANFQFAKNSTTHHTSNIASVVNAIPTWGLADSISRQHQTPTSEPVDDTTAAQQQEAIEAALTHARNTLSKK